MKYLLVFCLFGLPVSFAQATDCGGTGSIAERIASCQVVKKDRSGDEWSLVSRVYNPDRDRSFLIWQQGRTGALWTLIFLASQESAMSICKPGQLHRVTGQIDAGWKIASAQDYKNALALGVLNSLLGGSTAGTTFWTDEESRMIDLSNSTMRGNHPANPMPVICRSPI